MILCVTLNPCLDKTLEVPLWQPGDSVRGQAITEVVGGKGNNVARVLTRLGRLVRPATFFGGAVGARCETLLREADGLDPLVVATQAPTRVILTVRTVGTNAQSAFFDPDPEITPGEADALLRVVERTIGSGDVKALTLSGSSPAESTHGLYMDLISVARGKGIPVFLDTYGPALKAIWGFLPDYLQLNLREAGMYLGVSNPGEGDVMAMLGEWARRGVRMAVVSAGPEQVLAQVEGKLYRIAPPAIEPVNPIGSGDSLLGGVVDAWLSGASPETILRRAVACAVANALVWDAGGIDRASVDRLEAELEVEEIGGGGLSGPPVGGKGFAEAFVKVGVHARPINRKK